MTCWGTVILQKADYAGAGLHGAGSCDPDAGEKSARAIENVNPWCPLRVLLALRHIEVLVSPDPAVLLAPVVSPASLMLPAPVVP